MNYIGGYQIVDLKNINIVKNTQTVIPGIFNAITISDKPTLLTRIVINNVEYHDMFIQPNIYETSIGFRLADWDIIIGSNNTVLASQHV